MNYNSIGRTNYFQVTDEERYKVLYEGIIGEDKQDYTKKVDGKILHGFGVNNSIDYYIPASEDEEVKQYIANGESLYDESGNEVPVSAYDEASELYDSDGDIIFGRFDGDGCFDTFVKELQKILPDGECFAYEEVGHEGFRFLCGTACVATNKEVKWCDTSSFIEKTSKELTGKATSCSY